MAGFGDFLKKTDSILWRPACVAGRFAAAVGRSRAAPSGETLLVRPGGMGDLICAHIAIERLGLPRHELVWLIERRSEPWARQHGMNYLCYDRGLLRALRAVAGRYSRIVNLEQLFGLSQAFCAAAAAARSRSFAFATNRAAGRATHAVAYDWDATHEVTSFERILAVAFGKEPQGLPLARARIRPAAAHSLVAVAGLQSPERTLSLEQWKRLADACLPDGELAISCAPIDRPFATELCQRLGPRARMVGPDFGALCEAVATSGRVVTIDGGASHMASYYGVPATVVFTSSSSGKWSPLGAGSEILRRTDLSCQPCTRFGQTPPCPNGLACLKVPLPDRARNSDHFA